MHWLGPPGVYSDHVCEHGEGVIWTGDHLVWVDLFRGHVLRKSIDDEEAKIWTVGEAVGCVAPSSDGGYICGSRRGIGILERSGSYRLLAELHGVGSTMRMNDGAVDHGGRFWAGSMSDDEEIGVGTLYRMSTEGRATPILDGLTVSNGIDWSPDGRIMYLVDSGDRAIYAFAFDPEDGPLGQRSVLASFSDATPDGLTVDTDGFIWAAIWDRGEVRRLNPQGETVAAVDLPVSRATSCALGGADGHTLYITTSRYGLAPDVLESEPLAGMVFSLDVEAKAQPYRAFGSPVSPAPVTGRPDLGADPPEAPRGET